MAGSYQNDSDYFVSVRHSRQWHNIKDFIMPSSPEVQRLYLEVGADPWELLDFVCRNVSYRRDEGEFWQFPKETIASRQGDCEDTSILLTSLLRNFSDAYTVLGSYKGLGHAWVNRGDGTILETTYTQASIVPDPEDYCPYFLFNEESAIELWPGALEQVFAVGRNEDTKFSLMAAALGKGISNPGISNPGDYRYVGLPEACICESCGYELRNPGTHCRAIRCPVCGGVMWRKKLDRRVASY